MFERLLNSNLAVNFISQATGTKSSLGESMKEKFAKIFPSWPMMLATLISFLLVILILTYLLYKPIKKAVKARQEYIQKNINEAKNTNELSRAKLQEANQRLTDANFEAQNLIKSAKMQGEKVFDSYRENAHNEYRRLIQEAQLDIEQQREALLEESKNQIAKAATQLSRQILKKEVSKRTESEIIDEFLNEK